MPAAPVEPARRRRRRPRPVHPYTELLAASVPELRPGWLDGLARRRQPARRTTPANPDTCAFARRCAVLIPGRLRHHPNPRPNPRPRRRHIRCCRSEADLLAPQNPAAPPLETLKETPMSATLQTPPPKHPTPHRDPLLQPLQITHLASATGS